MNKQILFFVVLTVLPLAYPVIAAPNDGPGSTEKADRQFLQNLEQTNTARASRGPNAPMPAEEPRAVAPDTVRTDPRQMTTQPTTVVKAPRTIVLAEDYDQVTEPDEVAAYETIPEERPTTVTHVTVVRPARSVRVERRHSTHRPLHRFFSRLLNFDD